MLIEIPNISGFAAVSLQNIWGKSGPVSMACPVSSLLMTIPLHLCFVWPRQFHHNLELSVSTSLSHVCLSCLFTSFSLSQIWEVSSPKNLIYCLQHLLEDVLPLGCTFKYNQIQSWLEVFHKLITSKKRTKNSTKLSSLAAISVNKEENKFKTKLEESRRIRWFQKDCNCLYIQLKTTWLAD